MLVLNRKVNQRLVLGDHIELIVLRIKGNRVTLGLRAPNGVSIYRGEVQRRMARPPSESLRHDAKTTSVFLDFHRACPGWDHNWPATSEGESFFPDFPSDSLRESEGKSGSLGNAVSQ